MSNRRYSINDIKIPPNLLKKLTAEVLKEISKQDEATFYEWFEGLNLEEVSLCHHKFCVGFSSNNNCEVL